jgi:hypothetical protein
MLNIKRFLNKLNRTNINYFYDSASSAGVNIGGFFLKMAAKINDMMKPIKIAIPKALIKSKILG